MKGGKEGDKATKIEREKEKESKGIDRGWEQ